MPRGRALPLESHRARPRVLGILNLTPDSFSDGGLWSDPGRAVEHGLALLAAGADALDLGAESTRPGGGVYGEGARDVPPEEEIAPPAAGAQPSAPVDRRAPSRSTPARARWRGAPSTPAPT